MCLFWTQRKIFWRMRETAVFFSPTMEVNGAPKQPDYKLSSEYLPLCSEQTHSYRFGSTWGWVNDDWIFIFGCTVPLNLCFSYLCITYIYIYIWRVHLQKQITLFLTIFKNQFFSLCNPINLNQTAVGLFWLGTKLLKNTSWLTQ